MPLDSDLIMTPQRSSPRKIDHLGIFPKKIHLRPHPDNQDKDCEIHEPLTGLSNSNADINPKNNQSAPPRQITIELGAPRSVKHLTENNADNPLQNKHGVTPLEMAGTRAPDEKPSDATAVNKDLLIDLPIAVEEDIHNVPPTFVVTAPMQQTSFVDPLSWMEDLMARQEYSDIFRKTGNSAATTAPPHERKDIEESLTNEGAGIDAVKKDAEHVSKKTKHMEALGIHENTIVFLKKNEAFEQFHSEINNTDSHALDVNSELPSDNSHCNTGDLPLSEEIIAVGIASEESASGMHHPY